jgi:Tfp pilus assembly protein PilN
MSSLNLLPPQLREDRLYALKNRRMLKFMQLFGATFLIVIVVLALQQQLLGSQISRSNQQLASAKADMLKLNPVEAQAIRIQARLNAYDALLKKQTDWAGLMHTLSTVASPDIYFTAITADVTANAPIQIDGSSRSDSAVAGVVKSMLASGRFSSVDITSINPDFDQANFSKYSFSLQATLNKGATK